MAKKVYGFKEQLIEGQLSEESLDNFFRKNGYGVASMREDRDMQRKGIDSEFTFIKTGTSYPVEYKTDTLTQHTGNVFIETISVSRNHGDIVPGWIFTSEAKFLIYASVNKSIIIAHFSKLRYELPVWSSLYPERDCRNAGYTTKGILVPYSVFEECASKVIPWDVYERST